MTTGEKLSKLRKENNYTQEALAEKLGVSRQAISKWESDGAFPETDKLIQLAKLYNCSIDYLLRNDNNSNSNNINRNDVKEVIDEPINYKEVANQSLKKYLCINLATCLYSIIAMMILLLLFLFPVVGVDVTNINEDNFFNSIYGNGFTGPSVTIETISFNLYEVIGSSSYEIGNFILLIGFIIQLIQAILGIAIYLTNNKKIFKVRKILAYIAVLFYVLFFIIVFKSFMYGIIIIIIGALINAIGLTTIKYNKYQEIEIENVMEGYYE